MLSGGRCFPPKITLYFLVVALTVLAVPGCRDDLARRAGRRGRPRRACGRSEDAGGPGGALVRSVSRGGMVASHDGVRTLLHPSGSGSDARSGKRPATRREQWDMPTVTRRGFGPS
jgi:hypothetical protein